MSGGNRSLFKRKALDKKTGKEIWDQQQRLAELLSQKPARPQQPSSNTAPTSPSQ
jgi:hypothetical protein